MAFTTDLFSLVAQTSTSSNLVLSPLSVALALSHLALGTGAAPVQKKSEAKKGSVLQRWSVGGTQMCPPSGTRAYLVECRCLSCHHLYDSVIQGWPKNVVIDKSPELFWHKSLVVIDSSTGHEGLTVEMAVQRGKVP